MAQILNTIASYKEMVNAEKDAHKMISSDKFDAQDIKWDRPDASFQNKIKSKYIVSTVVDTSAYDGWGVAC